MPPAHCCRCRLGAPTATERDGRAQGGGVGARLRRWERPAGGWCGSSFPSRPYRPADEPGSGAAPAARPAPVGGCGRRPARTSGRLRTAPGPHQWEAADGTRPAPVGGCGRRPERPTNRETWETGSKLTVIVRFKSGKCVYW